MKQSNWTVEVTSGNLVEGEVLPMLSCSALAVATSLRVAWWFSFPNKSQSRLPRAGEEAGDWICEYACWGTMSRLALTWESWKVRICNHESIPKYMMKNLVPYRSNQSISSRMRRWLCSSTCIIWRFSTPWSNLVLWFLQFLLQHPSFRDTLGKHN